MTREYERGHAAGREAGIREAAEVAAYEAGFVPVKEEDFRRAILALLDAPAPSEDRT